MDNYLVDRQVLGKFIDRLLSEKFSGRSEAELEGLREQKIKELDDRISLDITSSLSDDQLDALEMLLDAEEQSADVFEDFFKRAGINLEEKMQESMNGFARDFMDSDMIGGGKNE